LQRATGGGGLGNSREAWQVRRKRGEVESRKEIVQTGQRGSGPDGRNPAIWLDENEASGFGNSQAVAELGIGIPKGRKSFSGFCHELMNLVRCSREKKKPGGFCFSLFHRNGEIFRKLETAVAVVGKENEYHGLFFGE
jgi:hypothetical protein